MPATIAKTITTALWVYEDPEGQRRIGYHGQRIELGAAEAERGEREGVFNQPPAGTVTSPGLPHDVRAENFAEALVDVESRVPAPPGDEVIAPLRHDVQPVVAETEATQGGTETTVGDLPARNARKAEVVDWVAGNLTKADGSEFSKSELTRMNKGELWDLIDSTEA